MKYFWIYYPYISLFSRKVGTYWSHDTAWIYQLSTHFSISVVMYLTS